MNNRRDFLKQSLLGAGAMALMNAPQLPAANGKPPTRFIFMHRGNGLWPRVCVPPSLMPRRWSSRSARKRWMSISTGMIFLNGSGRWPVTGKT